VENLVNVLEQLPRPSASIVVLTHNNLELTRACLDSIDQCTEDNQFETIVVDNASTDDTQEFLKHWAGDRCDRRLILNAANRGFAAGNNQGLAAARGDYLVMLNNDTEVTQGWLPTLMNHLRRSPGLGIVGPVTDNIGNEARITLRYRNRRVDQAGWKIACAEDVFVRHHLSATFGKLGAGRRELLERNRKIYEAKWGAWIPHQHR
jgi:GT2 family glycosyltransferase